MKSLQFCLQGVLPLLVSFFAFNLKLFAGIIIVYSGS